jgi:hypothetical protein
MNVKMLISISTILLFVYSGKSQEILSYDSGKTKLQNNNIRLNDKEQLRILFDTLKNKFTKEFNVLKSTKTPFKDNNKGCQLIADSFMEFAGSYKFDDSTNALKKVGFGNGYVCSYANIASSTWFKSDSPLLSFMFTNHRVIKFKLKDSTEYVFDMVIGKDKPIEFQNWLSQYKKYNNSPTLDYKEVSLIESITEDKSTYTSSPSQRMKAITIILKHFGNAQIMKHHEDNKPSILKSKNNKTKQ